MKSLWKGSIAFGLVNIPVKLYSAVEQKPLKIRLLHKDKLSPIRYKKWCDACTEEVSQDEIVRGIESPRTSTSPSVMKSFTPSGPKNPRG